MPANLTESMAQDVLQLLFDEHILTEREGNLLLLLLADSDISNSCRAQMMIKILQRLDRDDEI